MLKFIRLLTFEGSTGDFRPNDPKPVLWNASCVNAAPKKALNINRALISHICGFSIEEVVEADPETASVLLKRKSGLHDPRRLANAGTLFLPSPSIHCATYQTKVKSIGKMESIPEVFLPGVEAGAFSGESLRLDRSTTAPRCW